MYGGVYYMLATTQPWIDNYLLKLVREYEAGECSMFSCAARGICAIIWGELRIPLYMALSCLLA